MSNSIASQSTLRQFISQRVSDYCAFHNAYQSEAYNYLYKRLYYEFGVNVYRLHREPGEYIMDALERDMHLGRMYGLIMSELTYTEN